LSFPRQIVAAFQISFGNRGFRLIHELLHLIHHLLPSGRELAVRDFLQIFFGGGRELLGGTLIGCLIRGAASEKLYRGLVGSSVANNLFGRRARG
jgi:hypothetical protein